MHTFKSKRHWLDERKMGRNTVTIDFNKGLCFLILSFELSFPQAVPYIHVKEGEGCKKASASSANSEEMKFLLTAPFFRLSYVCLLSVLLIIGASKTWHGYLFIKHSMSNTPSAALVWYLYLRLHMASMTRSPVYYLHGEKNSSYFIVNC